MELLDGETLETHLQRADRLRLGDVVGLLEQLAEALDELHAKGIVHRDIKPANIFVTERGDAKVLDFGLAKLEPKDRPGEGEVAGSEVSTP